MGGREAPAILGGLRPREEPLLTRASHAVVLYDVNELPGYVRSNLGPENGYNLNIARGGTKIMFGQGGGCSVRGKQAEGGAPLGPAERPGVSGFDVLKSSNSA